MTELKAKQLYDQILEFTNDEDREKFIDNLTDEDLMLLNEGKETINPYKFCHPNDKQYVFSIINNRENYWRQFSMILFSEYLYRMLSEHEKDEREDYHFSREEVQTIKRFLDVHLQFNPDLHVKSAFDENTAGDPERKEATSDELINNSPPIDTMKRLKSFGAAFYDEIREKTESIFLDKQDFSQTLIIYEDFPDTEEGEDLAKEFMTKYQDEFKVDVSVIKGGLWTFLGDTKFNKERIEFYDKHNSILAGILDKSKEDKKLADDIISQRVKGNNRINDKTVYDNELFKEYTKLRGKQAKRKEKGKDTAELDAKIEKMQPEIDQIEDMARVPENALQVDTYVVDGEELKKGKFYTKAETQQETAVRLRREGKMSAEDYKKFKESQQT